MLAGYDDVPAKPGNIFEYPVIILAKLHLQFVIYDACYSSQNRQPVI